jgi:hypothetical protein
VAEGMAIIEYSARTGFVFVNFNDALLYAETFVNELGQRAIAKTISIDDIFKARKQIARADEEQFENLAVTGAHIVIAEGANELIADKNARR